MSISDVNLPKFEDLYPDSSGADDSSSHSVPTAVIILLPLITGVIMMAGIWCFAVKRGARRKPQTLVKEQEQQSSLRGDEDAAGELLIQMQQVPPVVVRPGGRHVGAGTEVEDAPPPYSVAVESTARDGQRRV